MARIQRVEGPFGFSVFYCLDFSAASMRVFVFNSDSLGTVVAQWLFSKWRHKVVRGKSSKVVLVFVGREVTMLWFSSFDE